MTYTRTGFKNTIKLSSQLANMSKITNMSIKRANDAGIMVIDSGKNCKPCELQLAFLDASDLANDWDGFLRRPIIDWQC